VAESSRRARAGVRPRTTTVDGVRGPYSLVTNPMVRGLDLHMVVPLSDIE
jgi:hypothetical protein